jgi:AraC family transcriptional regulator, transcriptional activator of pobA
MDSPRIVLHYPNMPRRRPIPTYALYGEADSRRYDWLHWETIQSRSRLHDYAIAPHRHEQLFQILSLTGGRGEVVLDGKPFTLKPHCVVVVPALTVHSYKFSPKVEGVVVTMMERDVASLGIEPPPAQMFKGDPALAELISRLIAEADHPTAQHDLAMRAHLTLLLLALNRMSQHTASDAPEIDRARTHAQAFRHLVDRQFRTTRRVGDYANAIGISQTHLNRVCRQELGASSLAVIERRIALEARRQLLFSSLTIKQIGADLGYDDPAYFTRFVTRTLGASPAAIRREGRGAL